MTYNRFINKALSELQESNCTSILDYEDSPCLTLEEAVAKIITSISFTDYVAIAKRECNRESTLLTWDESATIYLYTMPTAFSFFLNNVLRAKIRHELKSWFGFLKLFITALEKLPSRNGTLWRGVNYDDALTYVDNDVHIWWGVNSCSMNPQRVQSFLGEGGTLFVIDAIHAKDVSAFSAIPDEQEVILMPGTRVRRRHDSLNFIDRLFVVHLEEINPQSNTKSKSNYLFEEVRQEYQRNNRLHRITNPTKSFSIEESYINLAMVTTEDQREKEKQLYKEHHVGTIMGSFEQIYGMKTVIEFKDILKPCKNLEKQVIVFGRAGIGKSTFCRYIAYQWARGSYWSEYELLALIPLRRLTTNRYPPLPPGRNYSLIDLVKNEIFSHELSETEESLLKNQFDVKKTLWILDGYDEIIQNVPPHLKRLFEQLLRTPHHIITSRPYSNMLSYDVQMEITGFSDKNIEKYVQQFFDQMKDELDAAKIKNQTVLKFLKSNPSMWGVAHIPVNLELICCLWSDEDCSETTELTITKLYTMMAEWLCRRYLASQNYNIQRLSEDEVNQLCQKELTFLEILAFNAMENNTIIIRPPLLKKALQEAQISFHGQPHVLNIGILKSFNKQGTGTQIETKKDHYFIHLSFQEYFAARYLITALQESSPEKVIHFIKHQKYNQRYALVFTFASGLLGEINKKQCSDTFWDALLGEPLDLVGIRHMQLVISCLEATFDKSTITRYTELVQWIATCIQPNVFTENRIIVEHISQSLQRAQSVVCDHTIINVLNDLLHYDDIVKTQALSFIARLKISNPSAVLITSIITSVSAENEQIRGGACQALGEIGGNGVTKEVISKLVSALEDASENVRWNAYTALRNMCEKGLKNEVVSKLVSAVGHANGIVRLGASYALKIIAGKMTTNEVISKLMSTPEDESEDVKMNTPYAVKDIVEKMVTNKVISKIVSALEDKNDFIRSNACWVQDYTNGKVVTNEVISKLVSTLGDKSDCVRWSACYALKDIGEKMVTNEVINKLVSALEDENYFVRSNACWVLSHTDEKGVTNEVISKLVSALGDKNEDVRWSACYAVKDIGEKIVTDEVISKLVSALEDENDFVRSNACRILSYMDTKGVTNEVISKLVSALGDRSDHVRLGACRALENMIEKGWTKEVISGLVSALEDKSENVRRYTCETLENMCEKGAMNEVVSKLVSALGDECGFLSSSVCKALRNMGEKVTKQAAMNKPVDLFNNGIHSVSSENVHVTSGIWNSSAWISQVSPKIIFDIYISKYGLGCLRNVSLDHLIDAFFTSENPDWLFAMTKLAFLQGAAVTVTLDKFIVYGRKEPVKLDIPTLELRQQLIDAFIDQAKQIHLVF